MDEKKFLIKLIVPELDSVYDVFLPIGRTVGSVIELLCKAINDISDDTFKINNTRCLYNRYSNVRYDFDKLIYETDIKNDSILVLL